MDRPSLEDATRRIGLELSEVQLDSFELYEAALYSANEVMNLTRVPREDCWLRHFLDSLLAHDLIPAGASVLDIGSGPGLPAWPLACARPDLRVTALDSNGKMLGFLRTQPLPNLETVLARAEEWDRRDAFDVVTGRALAPMPSQLELSAAPAKIGGAVIPMRAAGEETPDIVRLGLVLESVVDRELPGSGIIRRFPIYRKVKPTPDNYPRRWADIKTKPL